MKKITLLVPMMAVMPLTGQTTPVQTLLMDVRKD